MTIPPWAIGLACLGVLWLLVKASEVAKRNARMREWREFHERGDGDELP